MTDILDYLRCPLCGEGLTREGKSLLCGNRHTFDLSKSGYVNLLPPGKGKNAHTGDEKAMIDARVNFLKRGFYNCISDKAAELIAGYAPVMWEIAAVCDMGSGEGWHTCRMAEKTAERTGANALFIGIDASKHGADRASKLSRARNLMPKDGIGAPHEGKAGAWFLPANLFHTPFPDGVFSAAVSMFAPVAWEEAFRILADDGVLMVVSSGREHLLELRQVIYDEVHLSEEGIKASPLFEEAARHRLRTEVHLPDADAIADLFTMTPFYYKTTEEGRKRLFAKEELTVTLDVSYTVYRKSKSPSADVCREGANPEQQR